MEAKQLRLFPHSGADRSGRGGRRRCIDNCFSRRRSSLDYFYWNPVQDREDGGDVHAAADQWLFASFMLARLGIPQGMADLLLGLDVPRWMLIMLLMGMFMDALSVTVIMAPILFPTILRLGYNPVWFGIIIKTNVEIAAIAPPIGFNLFGLCSIVRGIDYEDAVRGSLIFFIPLSLGTLTLIFFPDIAPYLLRQAH